MFLAFFSCGKKGSPIPKGLPVPTAVSDLRGEVKDGVLFVSFSIPNKNRDGSDARDLAGFRILKSCGGCGGGFELWKSIRLTDRQGFTVRNDRFYTYDNDLRPGFEYGYRVIPYTTKDVPGDASNTFSVKWQEPPARPEGVTVEEEDSRATLSWGKINGLSYNVYRWDDAAYPLKSVNPSPLSSSQFTESKLQNGKEYRYEVRAVKVESGVQYEGEGTTVSATPRDRTPPAPPVGLKMERKEEGVLLSWTANTEDDCSGYNVYRIVSGKPKKVNGLPIAEPRFFDEKPEAERYMSYYVTAVDRAGNEGRPSREQIIILKE
jgi:hypothetical protein